MLENLAALNTHSQLDTCINICVLSLCQQRCWVTRSLNLVASTHNRQFLFLNLDASLSSAAKCSPCAFGERLPHLSCQLHLLLQPQVSSFLKSFVPCLQNILDSSMKQRADGQVRGWSRNHAWRGTLSGYTAKCLSEAFDNSSVRRRKRVTIVTGFPKTVLILCERTPVLSLIQHCG